MLELMIADDNVRFAEHLNYVLTKEKDFKVINISHNGLEAIMYYNLLKPDILLLDLDMPGIDGLGVMQRLTDDKKNIIVISGSPEYRSKIKNAHRIEWILDKTVSDEALINAIKSVESNLNYDKIEKNIVNLLKSLNFDLLSKGTSYLLDAIFIAYEHSHKHMEIDSIMKQVAAKNSVRNHKNVYSTMDKCIKSTYGKQSNPNLFNEILPNFDEYKLSAKQFIDNALTYLETVKI